jgi:ribosomal protein S27AE
MADVTLDARNYLEGETMAENKLPRCPRCGFRMIAQPEQERLWCQACGYQRNDPEVLQILRGIVQEKPSVFPIGFLPDVDTPELDPIQQVRLKAAIEALEKGNKQAARYLCDDLLKQNHRLVGAYYILYLAADTPLEKARHLASILVMEPQHVQAKRELDRLKRVVGRDIKPSFFTVSDQHEIVNETIPARGQLEDCPMCGGHTLYVEEDQVKCLSCGYRPKVGKVAKKPLEDAPLQIDMPADGGFHELREALWQRKYGGGREWVIAKRVLACQNCGAQLTLSGSMMTQQCAFCDSQHILEQDAIGSFQEPDAVLPAQLNQQEAAEVLLKNLPPEVQRRVVRQETVGIFLPFWSFKGDTMREVLVPGCREPSTEALQDLQPFYLKDLRPYDQRYLAHWSAQLYSDDMIQASIAAGALPENLTYYRLLLLPVWMTTLHLEGGGYYHSLVNGQTGEVVITERVDSGSSYQAQKAYDNPAPEESVIRPLPPRDE